MSTATDEDTSMDIPNYNDPAYCKSEGVVVVTSFAYRSVQVLYSFISGVAIFCVLRVYFRYIRASKLHTNIQKLLTLFLFAAVLINTSFIVMQMELQMSPSHQKFQLKVLQKELSNISLICLS
ncbi:hypothetical protein RB195_003938 [Necator americanus]|uniref:G-protein coupled receptors family 3 profile domain-containing protein n=1 Tax=Necator americanus TaxID=51031 RepID=A0ABR1DQZ5_NECAM